MSTQVPPCYDGVHMCTQVPPCYDGVHMCTRVPPCLCWSSCNCSFYHQRREGSDVLGRWLLVSVLYLFTTSTRKYRFQNVIKDGPRINSREISNNPHGKQVSHFTIYFWRITHRNVDHAAHAGGPTTCDQWVDYPPTSICMKFAIWANACLWPNVGSTLAQHWINIGSTSRVCLAYIISSQCHSNVILNLKGKFHLLDSR